MEGGRVLAVGPEDSVRKLCSTGTVRHSLAGRLVLPGLIDVHMHLPATARAEDELDLRGVSGSAELAERIGRWEAGHPTGPVLGRGWDQELFPDRQWPTNDLLDRIVPHRPAVLVRVCGHAAVLNSTALERVGIDRRTPDPPGGRIGRHGSGAPNGLLFERALERLDPWLSEATFPSYSALRRTLDRAAGYGLTTLGVMSAEPREIHALSDEDTHQPLPVRLRFYLRLRNLSEARHLRERVTSDRVRLVGVKGFVDGSFGARTAWLREPYLDGAGPADRGTPISATEELVRDLETAQKLGLAPALHAIGDAALVRALEVFDAVGRCEGARIEHAALVPPEVWPLLDRVRPALAVQPRFVWSDRWLAERLGSGRVRWAYPFRTLLLRGHLVAGSSDSPVEPLDPWTGMAAASQRTDPEGRSANPAPEETLTAEAAVGLYTANGGRALGEPTLGTLEPGSAGDFVVLDVPEIARALSLGPRCVRSTWRGGENVYHRPDGPPRGEGL